jgi:hypothetical protein
MIRISWGFGRALADLVTLNPYGNRLQLWFRGGSYSANQTDWDAVLYTSTDASRLTLDFATRS